MTFFTAETRRRDDCAGGENGRHRVGVGALSAGWTHSLAVGDLRPPYSFSDAAQAARIAAGLVPATAYDSVWLDVTGQGERGPVDRLDAVLIARTVAGLSANP